MSKRVGDLLKRDDKRRKVVTPHAFDGLLDIWGIVFDLLQPKYSDIRSFANVCRFASVFAFRNLTRLYLPKTFYCKNDGFLNSRAFSPERLTWLRLDGGSISTEPSEEPASSEEPNEEPSSPELLQNLFARATSLVHLDVPSLDFLENTYLPYGWTTLRSLIIRTSGNPSFYPPIPAISNDFLSMAAGTKTLVLYDVYGFTTGRLKSFTNLESLTIDTCDSIYSIDGSITSILTGLTFLSLNGGDRRIDYGSIAFLTSLKELHLIDEIPQRALDDEVLSLSALINLERLEMGYSGGSLNESKVLGSLPLLKSLRIYEIPQGGTQLPESYLDPFTNLRRLELVGDLGAMGSGLSKLVGLTDLRAIRDRTIRKEPLSVLSSLTRLEVKNCACPLDFELYGNDIFDDIFRYCSEFFGCASNELSFSSFRPTSSFK